MTIKNFESIMGHPFPIDTVRVLRSIGDERDRQNQLFPDQHLPNGTSNLAAFEAIRARSVIRTKLEWGGVLTWRDVLAEEVAEAFAETDPARLRDELVQVAAVAARWIEDIDHRENEVLRAMSGPPSVGAAE